MLHLTITQLIRAAIDAHGLVESLVEAKVYSRGMDARYKAEADEDVVRKFRTLAAELGYRIEPITSHAVLKQELVESLSGRDEPSEELAAMRERVK